MMLNKSNCDWLLTLPINPMGPWPMKAAMESIPSAVSLFYLVE